MDESHVHDENCTPWEHVMDRKNLLYGDFRKSNQQNAELHRQAVRKALDLPEEMGDITTKTEHHYHSEPKQTISPATAALATASGLTGIGGIAALLVSLLSSRNVPPPTVSPPVVPPSVTDKQVEPVELELKWWVDEDGRFQIMPK